MQGSEGVVSDCCRAPRRPRLHHVLDDIGGRGLVRTYRWVLCAACGDTIGGEPYVFHRPTHEEAVTNFVRKGVSDGDA